MHSTNTVITLPTMADIRIITYNTQGLQGIQKRLDIFDYLKNKKCHIYCLQDTHFTAKDEIILEISGEVTVFSATIDQM